MTRSTPPSTDNADNADASATSQQELYGRLAPIDLEEGRADETDVDNPEPGRGTDASGQPSTARSGANTQ